MTDSELQAIRDRAEKATPGPWIWDSIRETPHCDSLDGRHMYGAGGIEVIGSSEWLGIEDNDRDFIAHAREDIPKLLAELERLKEAVRVERQACARIADEWAKDVGYPFSPASLGREIAKSIRERG